VIIGLYDFLYFGQFELTIYLAQLRYIHRHHHHIYFPRITYKDIKHIKRIGNTDSQYAGCPLKPSLSRIVASVKHLAQHISIENALIPIFILQVELGDYVIVQLCVYSRSLGTLFELLTTTISSRFSSLRCADLPIENALRG